MLRLFGGCGVFNIDENNTYFVQCIEFNYHPEVENQVLLMASYLMYVL